MRELNGSVILDKFRIWGEFLNPMLVDFKAITKFDFSFGKKSSVFVCYTPLLLFVFFYYFVFFACCLSPAVGEGVLATDVGPTASRLLRSFSPLELQRQFPPSFLASGSFPQVVLGPASL